MVKNEDGFTAVDDLSFALIFLVLAMRSMRKRLIN